MSVTQDLTDDHRREHKAPSLGQNARSGPRQPGIPGLTAFFPCRVREMGGKDLSPVPRYQSCLAFLAYAPTRQPIGNIVNVSIGTAAEGEDEAAPMVNDTLAVEHGSGGS